MHKVDSFDKEQMQQDVFKSSAKMFNVSIPDDVDLCEVWGTSMSDLGGDYCEYRFYKDGVIISTQRVDGY